MSRTRYGTVAEWGIALASLGVVGALAAFVVTLPIGDLVAVVPDDAFYYLEIARNLASTGTSTFDGEHLASGYHPGWMLLMVGLARLDPEPESLLRHAALLGFFFHLATAVMLRQCLVRLTGRPLATVGAAVWAVSYLPLYQAALAMEATLYTFAFTVSYGVHLRLIAPRLWDAAPIPTSHLVAFGAALGFGIWARTEGILLLGCAAGWVGLVTVFHRPTREGVVAAFRAALVVGATALVVVGPWLAYALATFGTFRQGSSTMKTLWQRDFLADVGLVGRAGYLVRHLSDWINSIVPWAWTRKAPGAWWITAVWLILALFLALRALRGPVPAQRALRRLAGNVAYPLGHAVVAGVVYCVLFSDRQNWYLALPYLEVYLAAFAAVAYLLTERSGATRWALQGSAAVLVFATLAVGVSRYTDLVRSGFYAWQRDVFESLPVIAAMLPEQARLGVLNAGIPGYFGSGTVINLDGLVNEEIIPYWKQKRVDDYLRQARIDFICDEERNYGRALRFMKTPPELVPLATFPLTDWPGDRYLWRLEWAGADGDSGDR